MTQKTFGPYSPVRQAGPLYFVSGQIGIDPNTKQSSKTIGEQTKQALNNLKSLLEDNNLSIDQVVKTTVFLTDMGDFTAMNEVYLQFFGEPRPARSCVAVSELPRIGGNRLLVEIEAVVYSDV